MTTRHLTLALSLGLALAEVEVAVAQDWKTVTAKDGSFTVEMPTEPKYKARTVKTIDGKQEYVRHDYASSDNGRVFVIQINTFPSSVNLSKPKVSIQRGLDGLAKRFMDGGKWSNIRWTTYQGQPATDAVATSGALHIRNFFVFKGQTSYHLTYGGPPGTAESADADRFINSFLVKQ